MLLTDLEPRWLEKDGRRVGLTFFCPCCLTDRLTCFFEPTPFRQQVQMMIPIAGKDLGDRVNWVPSKADFAWTKTGDTFDNLTVSPSIDASAAKHWHGFIQGGEVR